MDEKYSKGELRLMLEEETGKLKKLVQNLSDDEAYTIRYPDQCRITRMWYRP